MTSRKRTLAAFATGALALPLLTAPAAFAQTATPAVQTIADFCVNAPEESPFNDIQTLAAEIQNAINCLAFADVTDGTAADKYSPERNVNRDQMARFIAQLIDSANEFETADGDIADLGAYDGTPQFVDTAGNFHFSEIERLAQEDIVNGGVGGRPANQYVPGQGVTRAQMATFIVNAIEFMTGETIAVPAGADYFTDDEGNVHEERINKLASLGVVQGVAAGTYQPDRVVNRDNMALFLARTLGELEERGLITAPEAPQDAATVTAGDVEGDSVVLTVAGDDVESVTVTGDCIEEQTFAAADDEDADTDGNQFTVVLNDDAAAGDCVLTVVTSFTEESGLADETDTITVTIPEGTPNPNENIDVAPDTALVLTPVTANPGNAADANAEDNRSFTVSGLDNDEQYRITLVECDNISRDADGNAVFDAQDTPEADGDFLADRGDAQADIVSVNGVAPVQGGMTPANTSAVANPVNGSITFTIDGDTVECVVPVVYLNGGAGQTNEQGGTNGALELDENGQPVEGFGIGGETSFEPEEAPNGFDFPGELIVISDEENDRFATNDFVYEYDANDSFFVDGDEVTLDEFEAVLSEGDRLEQVDYRQNEALSSTFSITNLEPAAPGVTSAGLTTDDTVVLTVTGVESGDTVTVYCEEDPFTDADADTVDDETTTADSDSPVCATATADEDADTAGFQVVVDGLNDNTTYSFVATITRDGEESTESGEVRETTAEEGFTVAPELISASLENDEVTEGLADTGDIYSLVFNEDLAASSATDGVFNFTDADGDTFIVDCGETVDPADNVTAATCTLGDSEDDGDLTTGDPVTGDDDTDGITTDELLIELLEPAEDRNAAGDDAIEYPLTLTAIDGVVDEDGNEATLGSDVTVS